MRTALFIKKIWSLFGFTRSFGCEHGEYNVSELFLKVIFYDLDYENLFKTCKNMPIFIMGQGQQGSLNDSCKTKGFSVLLEEHNWKWRLIIYFVQQVYPPRKHKPVNEWLSCLVG